MKTIKHYLKLLYVFARLSLLNQLEYRLNFIAGSCVELGYMLIKLAYLAVVLTAGVNIGGLTPNEITIFIGTYIFMTGIWMALKGLNSIPGNIYSGGLDLLMVKPGSLTFLQAFGTFNFGMAFPNVVAGIIVICIGWHNAGIPLTFGNIAGFALFILMGIALTYAIVSICMLLSFWVTSFDGIFTLFAALWDFNNMPMTMYHKIFQQIGTFIIPVFVITNWAGLFVLGRLSPLQIVWGIAVPLLLFGVSQLMWKKGLRRYSSANG